MTPRPPVVHVVMAVHDPQPGHLRAQLASLAAQVGVELRLHAVIADLVSGEMVQKQAVDAGVAAEILMPPRRLNAVKAFEFGLAGALGAAGRGDLFALSDQDDIWHPDKLRRGVDALRDMPGCQLVHSDARVVDDQGNVLAESLFALERRDPATGLRRLLYRNSVTGMTALFTGDVAAHALPFPQQSGLFFYHDLWLGVIAAAKGPVRLLRTPLVDYRQHAGNAVGCAARRAGPRPLSRPWLRQRLASFALACYLAKSLVLRADQIAQSEPAAFDRRRMRALRPYLRHYGPGLAFFADAAGYALRGYGTLADHAFSQGLVKIGRLAWALRRTMRLDITNRLREFDDIGYAMAPGTLPQKAPQGPGPGARAWQAYADPRKIPRWKCRIRHDVPRDCTILLPTLNPTEIFAGVATALRLGTAMAEQGARLRFVATDLPLVSPHASRSFVAERIAPGHRESTMPRLSFACGVTAEELDFAPGEMIVATAWWTAHLARHILEQRGIGTGRFHYLIQDYEPNFYAWGTEYAAAAETYSMPCVPIFNTTLLRDYFRSREHDFGGRGGLAFRPSIDIARYAALDRLGGRRKRRIALYGRPEVPRNMFPLCIEALVRFLGTTGIRPEEAELVSVGLAHDPVALPGGHCLQSLGKLPMDEYPLFLSTVDVGLALMYSPHPSHLPIEMAAAGVQVVTNGFGPKDLSRLSPLIRSAEPTPAALARALQAAWQAAAVPAPPAARQIDLSPLGMTLEEIAASMARDAAGPSGRRRVA
ncbi:rhamnosyltransferase WsaF family glycosyltransferase [Mangrovicoccus algicola]|uniref:Glycosyl transferase family 1 n=1 Tax=Mangrovicoccus algicola TaxID=2771008 RepID=A0A8J6Z8D6_9RHOB|nr:glycosyl transferase family 1 [Mangrovicoccus algicola]MBE3639789.1 glycosyl transferase family 1 [Mangrovicoccus algicola]